MGGVSWNWPTPAVAPSLAVDNLDFDEVPGRAGQGEIVEVGHRKQLLVDNHVIAGMSNLKRELGRVTKLNGGKPVLVRDQPWERSCTYYGTALHDGQKFQMWYRASLEPFALGYAESPMVGTGSSRNWGWSSLAGRSKTTFSTLTRGWPSLQLFHRSARN
ncbi:MAG: hypothetical protein Ct9H300mP1_34900 [Planctomycetaceae bacterium]|nr:MAG: hypothetical protein Ct9H300mP1_34900 [Planctomycetaceae bacterium]